MSKARRYLDNSKWITDRAHSDAVRVIEIAFQEVRDKINQMPTLDYTINGIDRTKLLKDLENEQA